MAGEPAAEWPAHMWRVAAVSKLDYHSSPLLYRVNALTLSFLHTSFETAFNFSIIAHHLGEFAFSIQHIYVFEYLVTLISCSFYLFPSDFSRAAGQR